MACFNCSPSSAAAATLCLCLYRYERHDTMDNVYDKMHNICFDCTSVQFCWRPRSLEVRDGKFTGSFSRPSWSVGYPQEVFLLFVLTLMVFKIVSDFVEIFKNPWFLLITEIKRNRWSKVTASKLHCLTGNHPFSLFVTWNDWEKRYFFSVMIWIRNWITKQIVLTWTRQFHQVTC